ncbi:MAG: PEP-CTERM sorting domain-containing protein [Thiobacillaceae bacterium]|jgi:hypothetical protein|nr:PEP-CTERM sorting domain-containing protein [Thiobacillaceae bacterium]
MKALALSAAVLAGALSPAQAATYVIDPAQSYVKAYAPAWERVADQPGGGFIIFGSLDATDSAEPQQTFHWQLNWTQQTYGLSGSFELDRLPHAWQPGRALLLVINDDLATDAPGHAQFSLPAYFAQYGQDVGYSSHPCFESDFGAGPNDHSSCSGGSIGLTRGDAGNLQGGALTVQGAQSAPFFLFFGSQFPDSPEPPADVDYGPVQGLFEYQMVAVSAVPEPAAAGLMLAGLGLLALRRRSA